MKNNRTKFNMVNIEQLASIICIEGNSSTRFIAWLISNKDDQNMVLGSYRMLSEKSGVSVGTIKKVMPILKSSGFVKTVYRGAVHMINPKMIRPGERWQGSLLVQSWEEGK